MLPGLLQLAKFRKICIFDEWALGGCEKGATQVIRKCLISFSLLYQSWWLLRTAQLQGGVLAPRKQAEQQSWAVFSASARKISFCCWRCHLPMYTLCIQLPTCRGSSVRPILTAGKSQHQWVAELLGSYLDTENGEWMLAWECLVLGQHGPCAMWKPPGVLSCLVSWQKSKSDCPSVYFSNSK